MSLQTCFGPRAATVLALLALVAGPAGADEIKRSFDVGATGKLEIDSDVGSITIRTHSANRVEITVERLTRDSEDLKVDFRQDGPNVVVSGDLPSHSGRGNYRVRFDAVVPRGFDVDLNTAGGAIAIKELDGEVRAQTAGGSLSFGQMGGPVWGRTAGGSISLQDSRGDADLRTAGGSVDIGDVRGEVRVKTSGGSIQIGRVEGRVDADTSGGSIRVREAVGAVHASTSGGSIRAYISSQPTGDSELQTSGGTVSVELADGVGLDVDANGGNGGVHSDFPIGGSTSSERTLRGPLNGGGPRLYLRASGGVDIERR
jgi:Toastrack DUF4097